MAKIIIQMDKEDWDAVCAEIEDWYGVKMTVKQMENVVKTATVHDAHLLFDVADCLVDGFIGDTEVRERIVDAISNDLIGESWPTGAVSKKNRKEWEEKFTKACEELKIEFGGLT